MHFTTLVILIVSQILESSKKGFDIDAVVHTSCIFDAKSLFHIFQTDLKAAVPATNPTPALATPHKPQKMMGSIPLKTTTAKMKRFSQIVAIQLKS